MSNRVLFTGPAAIRYTAQLFALVQKGTYTVTDFSKHLHLSCSGTRSYVRYMVLRGMLIEVGRDKKCIVYGKGKQKYEPDAEYYDFSKHYVGSKLGSMKSTQKPFRCSWTTAFFGPAQKAAT